MRSIMKVLIPLIFIAAITGCEWKSGGDSSWSDSASWANFSGVYRGVNGGVLVTDYTTTPGTPATTNSVHRSIGVGNGGSVYNGMSLGNGNVVLGSVTVVAAGYSFSDDGSGLLQGAIAGTSGTVNHGTGIVSINLGTFTLNPGQPIVATYQHVVQGAVGSGGAGPGTSGIVIYSFSVHQQGNKLTITDNNGSVYKGKFGNVSTTGGKVDPAADTGGGGILPNIGAASQSTGPSTVVAQYSAEGVSAAGINITMTGTMQGVLGGAGDSFGNRIMMGTWIENPGRTGDINGQAAPIPVSAQTPVAGP